MERERLEGRELERAVLRIRLVGLALGSTLLLLAPRSDQVTAAATVLAYSAAVLVQRFAPSARDARGLRIVGIAFDVAYATALAVVLPTTQASPVLYAVAIATAALRFGTLGAAFATGGSILAYDVGLTARSETLVATDLWPVQLLLALGVVAAEFAWSAHRAEVVRERMRRYALAQRELIGAPDEEALLTRLAEHAVRTFAARGAWIEAAGLVRHARGETRAEAGATALSLPIGAVEPVIRLHCVFGDALSVEREGAALRDLLADSAPLLVAARDRAARARSQAVLSRVLAGIGSLERDRVANAILAQTVVTANEIAGVAAVVRLADGSVIAGDAAATELVALARDVATPALVTGAPLAPTAAVTSLGGGLALVAAGTRHDLSSEDLLALGVLSEIAGAAVERVNERSAIIGRSAALEREASALSDQLRRRDDAVAVAVHELRTPLTSVHAYAQLTSRNLQVVQQQVKQLDRLLADLLRVPGEEQLLLDIGEVDLVREARQVARQAKLVADRVVDVRELGDGPFLVQADRSRVEQVLENLLSNAVKFSPASEGIEIDVERRDGDIVVSVRDHGYGIPPDELGRVFDRYYRGSGERSRVPGSGIGLAVAREIVAAHGGRIWAASDGTGRGSTFFVALPAQVRAEAPAEPVDDAVR